MALVATCPNERRTPATMAVFRKNRPNGSAVSATVEVLRVGPRRQERRRVSQALDSSISP